MPRIRTIKPEFPQSETIGRLTRDARLLFIQLWTIADDEGRTKGHSKTLASLLYLYDDDAYALMDGWIQELERECCIVRYQVDGNTYVQILNWSKHQKIDKAGKSRIPAFVESSRILDEPSPTSRESSTTPRDSSTTDLVPRTVVSSTEDLVSSTSLSISKTPQPTATANAGREIEQDSSKQEHGQDENLLASELSIMSKGTIGFWPNHKSMLAAHLKAGRTVSEMKSAFTVFLSNLDPNNETQKMFANKNFCDTADQLVDGIRREKAHKAAENEARDRKAAEMQAEAERERVARAEARQKEQELVEEELPD